MAGMAQSAPRISDDAARAAYRAEMARGHTGKRWHMRPAGEESPQARRVDPSEVQVRWPGDVLPGSERVVNVTLGDWPGVDLEDGDDEADGVPRKRRAARLKGSKAAKDQASRKRGQEVNRERARQRREASAAAPEPTIETEPLPDQASVAGAPVLAPIAADTSGAPNNDGQLTLFGLEFWREAINGLPRHRTEEAAA